MSRHAAPVAFSNLDRVLWPQVGFTKGEMVDYYRSVGDVVVAHVRGRPMTLARFPTGVDQKGWYQTNCRGAPTWLRVAEVPASRGEALFRMCVVDDLDSLMWVVNQGTVELHPYLSAADAFDEPLALVFDLDPGPPAGLVECCRVAALIRDELARESMSAVTKTSGASGLHLYVGLAPGATFPATRAYTRSLARTLTSRWPELVTDGFTHRERAGRVLIDWRQNERARSQVAPYSLRATPWPLASTPVSWDEVASVASSGDARALFFGPSDVLDRIARLGDLFEASLERRYSVPAPKQAGLQSAP